MSIYFKLELVHHQNLSQTCFWWACQEAWGDTDFMLKIITGDESRVYDYDLLINQQPCAVDKLQSPRLTKLHQVRRSTKSMLEVKVNLSPIVRLSINVTLRCWGWSGNVILRILVLLDIKRQQYCCDTKPIQFKGFASGAFCCAETALSTTTFCLKDPLHRVLACACYMHITVQLSILAQQEHT